MLWLLTCTDSRPIAFALLEKWVGAQTFADPFRWIVATRDTSPYSFNLGQVSVERDASGLHPLCHNMLSALDVVEPNLAPNDLVFCIEDDDLYLPGYFRELTALAADVPLAGFSHSRYYNVSTRRYQQNGNDRHASLCETAFRAEVIPLLRSICERGNPSIDRALWSEWTGAKRLARTGEHVGCKGLPGTRGIGQGHRLMFGRPDEDGRIFKRWGLPSEYERFSLVAASKKE